MNIHADWDTCSGLVSASSKWRHPEAPRFHQRERGISNCIYPVLTPPAPRPRELSMSWQETIASATRFVPT